MTGIAEFEIAGIRYRAKPMDARRQLHCAMKFAGVFVGFSDATNPVQGVGSALAGMNPDDTDFIINACLVLVEREVPGGAAWAPVMTPQGQIMFDDIRTDLAVMMQMVLPVLEANVQGFLSALPKGYLAGLMARLPSQSS